MAARLFAICLKNVHEIFEHARGTREIVEARPIRTSVIHVLHVLHVPPYATSRVSNRRVSVSNFSGRSSAPAAHLPCLRACTTQLFPVSLTSRSFVRVFPTGSHYVGELRDGSFFNPHPLSHSRLAATVFANTRIALNDDSRFSETINLRINRNDLYRIPTVSKFVD